MKYALIKIKLNNDAEVVIEYLLRPDGAFDQYVKASDPKDMGMGLLEILNTGAAHANRLTPLTGRRVTITVTVNPHEPPWSDK